MLEEKIYVSGPSISQKEIDYVTDAVTNAWYGKANIYHERFERAFADYLGVRHAVCLPSCTSAIHLSLLALDVKPGDEVIVPDITWIASAAPVHYVGATPVFADVDPRTWCLSADSLQRCITPRTKAIIPVDLYGNVPDWDSLCAVAKQHQVPIIEDAAEAIGSLYKGKQAGSFGTTGVFSFHGSKTLTTGEGGMLVTNDTALFERILVLRDHGRKPGDVMFYNNEIGYKYKMSSMQAALGLAQLERIEELIEQKRAIFAWYQHHLSQVPGITLNYEAPDTRNTYWMVSLIADESYTFTKEDFILALREQQIDSRPFFFPLSEIPAYYHIPQAMEARARNVVSGNIHKRAINLPSGLDLTPEKIERICTAVHSILQRYRRKTL